MIITCINCDKKFNVNSELIPDQGRTIQCGSCSHIWFFKKKDILNQEIRNTKSSLKDKNTEKTKKIINKKSKISITKTEINLDKDINNKGSEIVKYVSKKSFTFNKFLSYVMVLIISLIGLVIVIDTMKSSLYTHFPNLEFLLFSLFETLKDIELFIKDLF